MCVVVVGWLCLLCFVVLIGCIDEECQATGVAGEGDDELGKFIWFSDFHFDPYFGTEEAFFFSTPVCKTSSSKGGEYGCDAPWSLIKSAIDAAKVVEPDPAFVVSTGDYSRHGNDEVKRPFHILEMMLRNVTDYVYDSFPNTTTLHAPSSEAHAEVIPSIGNNDVIPDYFLNITVGNNTLLDIITDAFAHTLNPEEEEDMRKGGYLIRQMTDVISIISINTVLYSIYHTPKKPDVDDPFGQLAWLEEQLNRIRTSNSHQVAYIVGHIPPSIGSWDKVQYWHDEYLQQYYTILEKYVDIIPVQLYGHLHSDEFRVGIAQNLPPLFIGSSVTPVYDNNPNFKVVTFNKTTGALIGAATHFLDISLPTEQQYWKELYTFEESYGINDLSASSMEEVVNHIAQGGNKSTPMENFLVNLRAGVPQGMCAKQCFNEWVCVLSSLTAANYQACMSHPPSPQTSSVPITTTATQHTNTPSTRPLILWISVGVVGCLFVVTVSIFVVARQRFSTSRKRKYVQLLINPQGTESEDV
eukprot:m.9970 g.9970  ORF g.9970 m.9970 type:complete len:526 (-) comp3579_c0_seq1:198-1775(-)